MKGGQSLSDQRVNRAEQWRKFDACPPFLRRLISLAPYEYAIPPKNTTAEEFMAVVFRDRDRKLEKLYGPDHPQIGSRTPERKPRR